MKGQRLAAILLDGFFIVSLLFVVSLALTIDLQEGEERRGPVFGAVVVVIAAVVYVFLINIIGISVGKMQFDYSKWVLTLSGGYDSRRLLYLLPNPENIKTITWGLESSLGKKGNDATIAHDVAKAVG
ncbi:MAG: hypothetical protein IH796_03475, partial [Deltaproteobacteria bacterium]|nr:hypothetical protein [Deltaproteobacteria bacterium]